MLLRAFFVPDATFRATLRATFRATFRAPFRAPFRVPFSRSKIFLAHHVCSGPLRNAGKEYEEYFPRRCFRAASLVRYVLHPVCLFRASFCAAFHALFVLLSVLWLVLFARTLFPFLRCVLEYRSVLVVGLDVSRYALFGIHYFRICAESRYVDTFKRRLEMLITT